MSIFQAIILGVIQGITEALPVSSSGHLISFPYIFGWEHQSYDFDVMIHIATLLAIIIVLRKEIITILRGIFAGGKEGLLGWKIVVGTIPIVIFGLAISSQWIDAVRTVQIVSINLIVWGVVLSIADLYSKKHKSATTKVEDVSWKQAILIGFIQAIALLPGSSRSGVTMSFGLFSGMNRMTAAKFSFLLGIPAIAGAGVLTLKDAVENGFSTEISILMVGFIAALLSGIVAMKMLFYILERTSFQWFAGYRIILGLTLLYLFM